MSLLGLIYDKNNLTIGRRTAKSNGLIVNIFNLTDGVKGSTLSKRGTLK